MALNHIFHGHESIGKRPNIAHELRRIQKDPMEPFLITIDNDDIYSSDVSRYRESYYFYYLSMRRFLQNMSVTARYNSGPRQTRKYGGKFSQYEKKVSAQYRELRPFLEFDLSNCLLHTRILLDRVAGLSRNFLNQEPLPSFTSFSDHKKFFQKQRDAGQISKQEEYASYIVEKTDWFDMPLKLVRDKFLVHSASKHIRLITLPNKYEVEMIIMLPKDSRVPALSNVDLIKVNGLRMSHDIETFLSWFSDYGMRSR